MSAYHEIISAVEDYLKANNKTGPDNVAHSKELVDLVRSKINDGELKISVGDPTILSYISTAANKDNQTQIVSGGPHGGYWLETTAQEPSPKQETTAQVGTEEGGTKTIQEKDLYPLVELWLSSKNYESRDMSSLKSGGKWGNPDIIGLNRVELFGSVEIEVASCEVKVSETTWEQFIFEAISHKRFSNRSWFCYRVATDDTPLAKGMNYYAERYRVGIVQIVLSDQEMADRKAAQKPLDYLDRVRERVPALYDPVPLQEKRDLVDRTDLKVTMTISI